VQDNIFLKNKNTYIYFNKLLANEKLAIDIKIFEFEKDLSLKKVHYAKKAFFANNFWILKNVTTVVYPKNKNDKSKIKITHLDELKTLKGFLPKIIHTIYEKNTHFSIPDAISLISILKTQNINTNKARSSLYHNIFIPIFPIFMIIIIFSFAPTISRLANMGLYLVTSISAILMLFGLFRMFEHLSYSATNYNTELFSLIPTSLLGIFAFYRYMKIN
jgi:lipopolysaccharide export system permease protein